MRISIIFLTSLFFLPVAVHAEEDFRRDRDGVQPNALQQQLGDTEAKREFLQRHLAAQVQDPQVLRSALTQLRQATPQQIDTLMAVYEQQVQEAQQHLQQAEQELARARAYQEYLEHRLRQQQQYANPGFVPVITTLPSGTFFPVGAVVSPDRRHVRITTSPFFSSVGPVRTFNFKTGESGFVPGFGPPSQLERQPKPQVYHDGLRTRIGPRPEK